MENNDVQFAGDSWLISVEWIHFNLGNPCFYTKTNQALNPPPLIPRGNDVIYCYCISYCHCSSLVLVHCLFVPITISINIDKKDLESVWSLVVDFNISGLGKNTTTCLKKKLLTVTEVQQGEKVDELDRTFQTPVVCEVVFRLGHLKKHVYIDIDTAIPCMIKCYIWIYEQSSHLKPIITSGSIPILGSLSLFHSKSPVSIWANYYNSWTWIEEIWRNFLTKSPFGLTTRRFGRYNLPRTIFLQQGTHVSVSTLSKGLGS